VLLYEGGLDKRNTEWIHLEERGFNPAMSDLQQEEAFQAFAVKNRELWLKLAYRVLENREEAEDVVQETLAILWEKRDLLQLEKPGAYAARSVWLNSLKRRTRGRKHLPLEEVAEPATDEDDEPEDWEELDPLELEGALQQLPEAQRTVIRMKYYMGLSFKEIGETLKISLNTAGSRCRYALQALREALGGRNPPDREKRSGT
jgi:RNA polymerase sigma-70 factor (ECF subfamily)